MQDSESRKIEELGIELIEHTFAYVADRMGIVEAHDEHCCEDSLCRACWITHYSPRMKEAPESNRAFEYRIPGLGHDLNALTASQKDYLQDWLALWAVMTTEQLAFPLGGIDVLSLLNERDAARVKAARVKAAAIRRQKNEGNDD